MQRLFIVLQAGHAGRDCREGENLRQKEIQKGGFVMDAFIAFLIRIVVFFPGVVGLLILCLILF